MEIETIQGFFDKAKSCDKFNRQQLSILVITPAYYPALKYGGPIISMRETIRRFVQYGQKVTVFTTDCNLYEKLDLPINIPIDIDGAKVCYFRRIFSNKFKWLLPYFGKSVGYMYSPAFKKKLISTVQEYDVIHLQAPFCYPNLIGSYLAQKAGIPYFYHARGVFDPKRLEYRSLKKKLYIKFFERKILQNAATLFALTADEAKQYLALNIKTPITIIPNGLNIKEYRQHSINNFTDKLAALNNKKIIVILFMGRIHIIKGLDLLIDSFIQISSKFKNTLLVVAGPDESGICGIFKRKLKAAGLINRVIFPGFINGVLKKDLLGRADIFVLPSMGEGFSISILEALASGCPVVISKECHFPEITSAGIGIELPCRNLISLTNSLDFLLSNFDIRKKMASKGPRFIAQFYNWDTIAADILNVYYRHINRKKRENI